MLAYVPDSPCWCRSGKKHADCHGNSDPPSSPGDPVPEGDEAEVFLSPTTSVLKSVLVDGMPNQPVYMPSPEPVQRPLRVPTIAAAIAEQPPRSAVALADLGRQRFSILDGLGLANPDTVEQRVGELSDDDLEVLRYAFLDLARCTFDRLLADAAGAEPPTTIWAGTAPPLALLGATLMWADHYLVEDEVSTALCTYRRPARLADELRSLIEVRPLVEVGLVVPVLHEAAAVIAGDAAWEQTETDLQNSDLVAWVRSQLITEGPTATSALLFTVLDDDDHLNFYLHARIVALDEATHTVTSRLLGPYDPSFNYGPWIDQSERQTTAHILQEVNLQLAMADAFGASWVTRSPFKVRVLERRSDPQTEAQSLVWADVPHLQRASAIALARVAADDVAVGALRERTQQAFVAMRHATPAERREQAGDLAAELAHAAPTVRRDLEREGRWKLAFPAAAGTASVAIGAAVGGPVGAVAGLFGLAAGLAPNLADLKRHEDPGYALVLGDGLVSPRGSASSPTQGTLSSVSFRHGSEATPTG